MACRSLPAPQSKHVDFCNLLRRLFAYRNQNSPLRAQTVDFCMQLCSQICKNLPYVCFTEPANFYTRQYSFKFFTKRMFHVKHLWYNYAIPSPKSRVTHVYMRSHDLEDCQSMRKKPRGRIPNALGLREHEVRSNPWYCICVTDLEGRQSKRKEPEGRIPNALEVSYKKRR